MSGTLLAALGAVSALAIHGCADSASPIESDNSAAHERLGTLGLALQLAPDVVLDTVEYEITGAGVDMTGSLPVPSTGNVFSTTISGIPAGQGYSLRLSSRARGDAGIACVGTASFDVIAGATTQVSVALLCDSIDTSGAVAINGSFNVCPAVSSTSITPSTQAVGSTIALTLAARDVDHGPAALAISWTSTSGTLANANGGSPTLTCTTVGPVTLHYEINDGSCHKEGMLTASCVAASTPDAGIDAGNGSDAGTGTIDAGSDAGSSAPHIVLNEVESNGGSPDDWVELYNAGSTTVDLTNWGFRDNDATHAVYRIAAGTTIAPGGYVVLDTSPPTTGGFPFGLGSADSAILYGPDGVTVVDSYSWLAHATSTYGRCPNGSGPFVQTTTSKGLPNICPSATDGGTATDASVGTDAGSDGSTDLPWPGPSTVAEVDVAGAFASNLSGLSYVAGSTVASSVLYGVQNGPSTLYRLHDNGTNYVSTTDNGWSNGKVIFYPNGTGGPDSEGVVYVPAASAGLDALYVSTERDNLNNVVSRLSVLQYDANASTTTLSALREWNLTADLPVVGPNLGLEAIAFVSDAELAQQSFHEGTGAVYNPNRYAQHGGGIFLVGVEGTGFIHVYALDHTGGLFTKLASFSSGMPAVMDLAYDPATNYLWAYGDDTQGNRAVLFEIEANMASLSYGQFVQRKVLAKPAGLPNYNNEGISFAPDSECSNGLRSFFWADDGADNMHSLRRGSITCGRSY